MGTRHLICVVKDNEYKVAQYGQWDGYPSGQGLDILRFLKFEYNEEKFKEGMSLIKFGTPDELNQQWVNCGANPNDEWVSFEISKIHASKYPENSRDTGSKILEIVQSVKDSLVLKNSLEFAKDSLFCEYGYVIDLDKNVFEIYEGFSRNPLDKNERFFFNGEKLQTNYKEEYEYYPIRFVKSYPLDKLPSEKDFLNELETNEEE